VKDLALKPLATKQSVSVPGGFCNGFAVNSTGTDLQQSGSSGTSLVRNGAIDL
jgi:hypothetical protein